VRNAANAFFWGSTEIYPATGLVVEFVNRKSLAEIGFTSSFDELSVLEIRAFQAINTVYKKVAKKKRDEAAEKEKQKSRARPRKR
jgi:hypothetical protein